MNIWLALVSSEIAFKEFINPSFSSTEIVGWVLGLQLPGCTFIIPGKGFQIFANCKSAFKAGQTFLH